MNEISNKKEHKSKIHPQQKANIFSKLFFCWALPFFLKGWKKDLSEEDLYEPLTSHQSHRLGDQLEKAWIEEQNTHTKPSIWRTLVKVYGTEMVLYGLIVLLQEMIVRMAQPFLIGRLLAYYSPDQTVITKNEAYAYAFGIIIITFLYILLLNSYFLNLQQLGMKARLAFCSLIYRKALRLSKSAMMNTTIGQMVNLMSNDVNRFDYLVFHIHYLILAPIESLVVIYFLYSTINPTALTGVILILAFIPLQFYIGKRSSLYRYKTAIKTDQRVRLMNEIITGIQVIKMYTWEKPFTKLVEMSRKYEMRQIRATSYLKAVTSSFAIFLDRSAIYLCVIAYVLTGNKLNAEYVFVVISFYNIIRNVLTIILPRAIAMTAEANVSVNRLRTFLLYDEITPEKNVSDEIIGISLDGVSAKWSSISHDNHLTSVDFHVGPEQLVAVVGPVGSGKTTLLHIILKELLPLQGNVKVSGTVSYAAQEPWLFAASIRQNILFGQELEAARYQEVVKVCALERDLALLPYGDQTIVGERGVMLSGGQKARINLARAIYKKADIYLLDDPLSAVDTHVGKHLFDECISKYLKNKCTVLVTHQLQYLSTVDKIYLLENGKILTNGSYTELKNTEGEFVKLLKEIVTDENNDNKKKDEENRKIKSLQSLENQKKPNEVREQRSFGKLANGTYIKYFKSGGSYFFTIPVLLFFIFAQMAASGSDLFITFWVNLEQDRESNNLNSTNEEKFDFFVFTSLNCVYIYSSIIIFLVIITLVRSFSFFKMCMNASKTVHNNMFSNIIYTKMRFFNLNPSGRVLNRFAKDMGSIDDTLPQSLIESLQVGLNVFAITLVLSFVNPWIIIPTIVIFIIFYIYKMVFLSTTRNLKRLEGTTRSPVFSHLAASLQGLSTIRAFGAQKALKLEFDSHQDLNSSAYYMFIACNRTFAFWLDINCLFYTGLVILSFLFIGTENYGGNVGLAITQSLMLTGTLQWWMRQWSELENQMTSVERVVEYTELEPEIDHGSRQPSIDWPQEGKIEFNSVFMQYSIEEPFVLKNLTFTINPQEKIGIVGRTGAGKSSLIFALFRLAPIDGIIIIDGIETKTIPLKDLRSKITIIPQEPMLFSGTLRKNLDPFDEYSDEELWNALDEVKLKPIISELSSGLSSIVSEAGSNFSVGQRQLLCLARAIIRSNKILILDEATANVDPQTDELIQNTIRKKFSNCTVLTIAHRLHTIMDSDRILVMDAGQVVEFDRPKRLLQNENGIFYGLVKQTGVATAKQLTKIANQH